MLRAACLLDQLTGSRLIFRNTQSHFFIFFIWFRIVVLIDILETCSCRFFFYFSALATVSKVFIVTLFVEGFKFFVPCLAG